MHPSLCKLTPLQFSTQWEKERLFFYRAKSPVIHTTAPQSLQTYTTAAQHLWGMRATLTLFKMFAGKKKCFRFPNISTGIQFITFELPFLAKLFLPLTVSQEPMSVTLHQRILKQTDHPAKYTLVHWRTFKVPPPPTQTLHRPYIYSTTVSTLKTHSQLSNHLWNLTSSSYPTDCVCVLRLVMGYVLQFGEHKRIYYYY